MTELTSYTNVYADLAQSAYINRKNLEGKKYNFANGLSREQKDALATDKSASFTFPNAKDSSGNDVSSVHLQSAIKISTHTYTSLPTLNDSYYNPKIFREAAA
ncbi:hypothetical protein [Lactovum odontotermitis]